MKTKKLKALRSAATAVGCILAVTTHAVFSQVMAGTNPNPSYWGLQLWLEANAGVPDGNNGAAVTTWTNQSASSFSVGNALTTFIGANNAPTFVPASIYFNNQPAIAFNGTSQGMDLTNATTGITKASTLLDGASYTMFVVLETAPPVAGGTDGETQTAGISDLFANGYNFVGLSHKHNAPGIKPDEKIYLSSAPSFVKLENTNEPISHDTAYDLEVVARGQLAGSTSLYLNGIENDNTAATAAFGGAHYDSDWQLGYQANTPGRNWNGQIAEVLVYIGVLSPADQYKVNAYLAAKYGITPPAGKPPLTTPAFGPQPGIYTGAQTVTISSEPGSTIFYTTNGSAPTSASPSGASPVTIIVPGGTNMFIQAYATNPGFSASPVARYVYDTVDTNAPVTIVSQIKTLANGKHVLYVDDKPFQSYGGQMRPDTWRLYRGYSNAQLASLGIFSWATNLNMNVVQVPIYWSDCEPAQNSFNWTSLQWAIGECTKYGLRMELLWFGSDITGPGYESEQPDYILSDSGTYPLMVNSKGFVLSNSNTNTPSGFVWTMSKEYTNSIAAECNAIYNMMGYLQANDTNHVVIGALVGDEVSVIFPQDYTRPAAWTDRDYSPNATALYAAGGYTNGMEFSQYRLAAYLNELAGAVKASPYKMWTRANWISTYLTNNVYNFDENTVVTRKMATNLDIISWDPYNSDQMGRYQTFVGDLSSDGNIPYSGEEPGASYPYSTLVPDRIIDTFAANGGGCCYYRVDSYADRVDNYLIRITKPGKGTYGIEKNGINGRVWTPVIQLTFGMLQKVMGEMAILLYTNTPTTQIQYFNSLGHTEISYNGTSILNGTSVIYNTTSNGVGIAFVYNNNMVLMSQKAGTFTIPGTGVFENGYYDTDGNWVNTGPHPATTNSNDTMTITLSTSNIYDVVMFVGSEPPGHTAGLAPPRKTSLNNVTFVSRQ